MKNAKFIKVKAQKYDWNIEEFENIEEEVFFNIEYISTYSIQSNIIELKYGQRLKILDDNDKKKIKNLIDNLEILKQ